MFNSWKKKILKINIDTLIKKAEEDNIEAQYELSLAYYKGDRVKKDIEKSAYWFERANETFQNIKVAS